MSSYAGNSWTEIAEGDKSLSETVAGKLAGAYTAIIDDLAPVQQMVRRLLGVADRNGVKDEAGRPISLKMAENPYKIARMFRGSYATGYSWLKNGIANRGASIRVPHSFVNNGYKGYLEDRRPNSQGDPYQIASQILKTIAEVPAGAKAAAAAFFYP